LLSIGAQTVPPVPSAITLKCKLVASEAERPGSQWFVELRDAAGNLVRKTLRMSGGTVHFKNLAPGIYRVILTGQGGRKRAESVDLIPAPGLAAAAFAKEIRVPASAASGIARHQVNLLALVIPKEAARELRSAEEARMRGDQERMVHHLERAVRIYPDYADAWNNLGAHYHRAGDYQKSVHIFTKVTELNPDFYGGWMNLGSSLLATGRLREAVDANQKAWQLEPDDARVCLQLALSYYYVRDYTRAKQHLLKVFDMDPAYPNSPQLYLAHLAMAEKSMEEAAEYLRSFLKEHPHAPEAVNVQKIIKGIAEGTLISEDPIRK
jgi:tetratricopeptide (TPR) repeat protein